MRFWDSIMGFLNRSSEPKSLPAGDMSSNTGATTERSNWFISLKAKVKGIDFEADSERKIEKLNNLVQQLNRLESQVRLQENGIYCSDDQDPVALEEKKREKYISDRLSKEKENGKAGLAPGLARLSAEIEWDEKRRKIFCRSI